MNHHIRRAEWRELDRIKSFFQNDLQRWWPSTDYEAGEPDMPHDTYFTRESNLYADFSDYGQAWVYAQPDSRGFAFDQILGRDQLGETTKVLERLTATSADVGYLVTAGVDV